jgi:hypothetical protein
MSFDLSGVSHKERISFNYSRWESVLVLADLYGWLRKGTTLEDDVNWSGTYYTNDGQVVSVEDANELANALERALPDVPREETVPRAQVWMSMEYHLKRASLDKIKRYEITAYNNRVDREGGEKLPDNALVLTLAEYLESRETPDILLLDRDNDEWEWRPAPIDVFSGEDGRSYIVEFIEFCRLGAFRIR